MVDATQILYGIGALAIWSFMYRENLAYRCAEYFYVGFTAANALVMGFESARKSAWIPLTQGNVVWIIPLVLSLGFIAFHFDKLRHFYMITISFVVAIGTGLALRGSIHASILGQIIGGTANLIGATPVATLTNIIVWAGGICALSYFVFTKEVKGPVAVVSRIGRMFIMCSVGVAFASTGLGRLANFTGIMLNLLTTDAIYVIPAAIAVIAIDVYRRRKK